MSLISSNGVLSSFALDLDTLQRKLLQIFSRLTKTVFCQELKFSDGLRYLKIDKSR